MVETIDDATTGVALDAERAVVTRLGGGCQMPIGAYATVEGETMHARGDRDRAGRSARGARHVRQARCASPTSVGIRVAERCWLAVRIRFSRTPRQVSSETSEQP